MKTLSNHEGQLEISCRLAQLAPADQGLWGKMSAHQMICHLRDSYCLALGEKAAIPATGFLQRTVAKWIALWVPMRWPKGYPTRPEVEQGKGGTKPDDFFEDREMLEHTLTRFCEALHGPCAPHPVFGPMQTHEWGRWGYLHASHHLRQFGH